MAKSLFQKRFSMAFVIVAVLLCAIVCMLSTIAYGVKKGRNGVQRVATNRSLPIYSVETKEKKIAISFDCAWGVDYTDTLLDVMAKNDVRCTFFAVQFWVEKYPEYVEKIVAAGHEMGTHSRTHPYMSKLSEAQIRDELTTSSAAIERLTGQKVTLFRPPYGDYNNLLIYNSKHLDKLSMPYAVIKMTDKDDRLPYVKGENGRACDIKFVKPLNLSIAFNLLGR